jgi:hypothetical protein
MDVRTTGLLLLISYLLLAFTGCQTITDNIRQAVSEKELAALKSTELLLLEYSFTKNKELLESAARMIDNINKTTALNSRYQAKVYGLLGEVAFDKGNMEAVNKYIDMINYTYSNEERYYILQALLTEDKSKKLLILETGLKQADNTALIKLYLARLYFQNNNYRLSTVYYDDALQSLDEKYKVYYQKERDLAYQFISTPPSNTQTNINLSEALTLEQLSVKYIITLLLHETDFFAHLVPKKNISDAELFSILKNADYIYDKTLQLDSICPRKDIAYLLLKILVYQENNPALLTAYSRQFQGQAINSYKPVSPVPDVSIGSYYFNAVLVIVEREIMELPDGINFFPDKPLSGLNFAKIIQKLKLIGL